MKSSKLRYFGLRSANVYTVILRSSSSLRIVPPEVVIESIDNDNPDKVRKGYQRGCL